MKFLGYTYSNSEVPFTRKLFHSIIFRRETTSDSKKKLSSPVFQERTLNRGLVIKAVRKLSLVCKRISCDTFNSKVIEEGITHKIILKIQQEMSSNAFFLITSKKYSIFTSANVFISQKIIIRCLAKITQKEYCKKYFN